MGWYTGGSRPGQEGTAVVAGHVDNALGLSGVFKHLGDMEMGNDVYIETTEGETLHFRVLKKEIYPYDAVPIDELFFKTGGRYLNLITCSGRWLATQHTYSHRLVVYTELVATAK